MYHYKIPQILQIYTEQKFFQEVSRIRMTLVLPSYYGDQKALSMAFQFQLRILYTINLLLKTFSGQEGLKTLFFSYSERHQKMFTFKQQHQQCQKQGFGYKEYIKQKEYVKKGNQRSRAGSREREIPGYQLCSRPRNSQSIFQQARGLQEHFLQEV